MLTHEITTRINRELKVKPRIRTPEIEKYATACGAVKMANHGNNSGGQLAYQWTEENYQTLKNTIEL